MSAVAMHFDPTFMGPRPSYTWPDAFDSPSPASMLGQDYSLILPPLSESSESPQMSPRTMSSSPPRYLNHPDQRSLKRRRERIRQDSRAPTRMNRAGSTSSYMGSPSLSMNDGASNMALPVYSTAPTSMSILAEPAPSMSYLPPYSPPLHDTQVFSSPYQQPLASSYGMPMDYHGSYAHPNDFSIPPTSDANVMYRMPAAIKTDAGNSSTGSGSGRSAGHGAQEGSSHVRVVQGRPKPRCWEHGCNGRQFSTFSNLLRHQREKSGQAAKATCPNCGAEFTRTTARNGHLLHDKCKQRRHT